MANVEGLFSLSNFEEASKNNVLDMSINESAMTESADPEAAKKTDDALRVEMNELTGLIGDLRKLSEDEKMDENLKKILKAKIDFLDTKRTNILKACQNSIKESAEVTESTEIPDKCPSCNPEVDFDPSTKENNTIPVPGGDKEQPTAKVDEKEIPVPGGDSEKPDAKAANGGETGVPSGTKIQLDSDEYNVAIDRLQQSFKEAFEFVGVLKNVSVVDKTPEQRYNEFMESAMDNAFIDYAAGPLFEKVDQSDKSDIKDIVDKIRKDVKKAVEKKNYEFYVPNVWARAILGTAGMVFVPTAAISAGAAAAGWQQIIGARLWQVLGNVVVEEGQIDALVKDLNEEFKDELGDYKIVQWTVIPAITDAFRTKFGIKNQLRVYMLLIDKKLPKEFKDAEKAAEKEEKEEKKED